MPPSLTLKQRLAALSLSTSSPSSATPTDWGQQPDLASSPRKRNFFNPWGKRPLDAVVNNEQARLQEVMSKMIYQAGVDFETRPMVVLNASALPDPRDVSYDVLLSRILSYLSLYVEADYTVVFFAAGGRYTPGWNWVWKAYRSLSRKYRKNLKQLYIVHSSFFSKMLFSLAGAIISPKFFRKISYIDTLSELAFCVPLTQIDIPPAVYQENLRHEKTITLPTPSRANVFGVSLEELMGYDGEKGGVPRVVRDCIQFIRETGMEEEGLFRRSPSSAMLRQAQEAYDRGHVVSLDMFGDPHLAAVLLKKYLRDLPDPLFSETLYPIIRRCPAPSNDSSDMASVMYLREILLPELAPCKYILLSHVLHLMHDVSLRSASNRMDAHNLAIVLTPNLVSGSNPARDVMMCAIPNNTGSGPAIPFDITTPGSNGCVSTDAGGRTTLGMIIKLTIWRYYEVFDEVRDRSEAVDPARSEQGAVNPSSSESSSLSETDAPESGYNQHHHQHHDDDDDDDEIDDEMLVMPIGPSKPPGHRSTGSTNVPVLRNNVSTRSSWNAVSPTSSTSPSGGVASIANGSSMSGPGNGNGVSYGTYKSSRRHRNTLSNSTAGSKTSSGIRSMHTGGAVPSSYTYATMSKAKSTISIEKGAIGSGPGGRKGSISIGRGTMKKSSGAGVEALSVTAEGFFTPPKDAPPVPKSPPTSPR